MERELSPEEKLFQSALYKLIGQPTKTDKLDTIATDLKHISEDIDTLRQSFKQLEEDLLSL